MGVPLSHESQRTYNSAFRDRRRLLFVRKELDEKRSRARMRAFDGN